jgi:hypothetical protein
VISTVPAIIWFVALKYFFEWPPFWFWDSVFWEIFFGFLLASLYMNCSLIFYPSLVKTIKSKPKNRE